MGTELYEERISSGGDSSTASPLRRTDAPTSCGTSSYLPEGISMRYSLLLGLLLGLLPPALSAAEPPAPRAENVIIVTLDGFRWQEFFHGAELSLMDKKFGGVSGPARLKSRF